MTYVPTQADAALLLSDGGIFFGRFFGGGECAVGEICFNTAMTGYQEVLSDPSYAGQIITFTFPHIGNVGTNKDDIEAQKPLASGFIVREDVTQPSNFRSVKHLASWAQAHGLAGIAGVDTRALTRHVRLKGAQNVVIFKFAAGKFDAALAKAQDALKKAPDMNGRELAEAASVKKSYGWDKGYWQLFEGGTRPPNAPPGSLTLRTDTTGDKTGGQPHVVAIDYGAKENILRSLASHGARVTVVPAKTSTKDILALKPDGVFLSNGPGDPAATAEYALPVIKDLVAMGMPIFGICLGHQLLGRALGGTTEKMAQGHRGANHPVKNLKTGKVEITAQNHGFAVAREGLPSDVEVTHISLFDQTVQGIAHKTKPFFGVQYHPESSPGPHDSRYLFEQFMNAMREYV